MSRKSNVEFQTIARIDLIKGKILTDIEPILEIVLDNSNKKLDDRKIVARYEDTYCPKNEFVDKVIDQMIADFKAATGEDIICNDYWGHIHDQNMSTNTHDHGGFYAAAVLYLSVPEGSGDLVFLPNINPFDSDMYRSSVSPEKGIYYMFPGYLKHYVTRNEAQEKRVSISFNFKKV